MWLATLLVQWIKLNGLFMVNDGNDDKAELYDPSKYNLEHAVNVYFTGYERPGDRMGGWFMSPKAADSANGSCQKEEEDCPDNDDTLFKTPLLSEDDTVFLLLHGNGKNRGAAHRLAAYKTFQSLGFYTLTIDYRGYGDSSFDSDKESPVEDLSESTVVEDALLAIRTLRKELGPKFKLILYGHSMGSGISTHAGFIAQEEGLRVDGIILDSPFHSFEHSFKSSRVFTVIDYLLDILTAMAEEDILFDSIGWLQKIRCPVRVLHAECDHVIPIQQSVDLVADAKMAAKNNIELIRFTEDDLGHIGISTTKGFRHQIADFAQLVRE